MKAIVVGAGILGSSITYQLAKRGVEVTVIDKGIPGDAASAASFAWLNSNDKSEPPAYHHLNAMSIAEWSLVARELGTSEWLRREGNLHVTDNDTDAEELANIVDGAHALGYAAVPVDVRALARLDPVIRQRSSYLYAAFFPDEGHITVPLLIHDLLVAARSLGATVRHSTGVSRLVTEGERVGGVVLDDGEQLQADIVVLAAGAGIGGLLATQGVEANTQGEPGITVTTSPGASNVATMLHLPGLSIRPDSSGRIIVRSSRSDSQIDLENWTLPEAAVRQLFEQTAEGVTDFDPGAVRAERIQIAYRPYPLDGLPVIGEWDGLTNLYVTTMHSGVTLGAISSRLVAEEIATGEKSPLLEGFRPTRLIEAVASGVAHFDPYAIEREKQTAL
jgi:glycine/D-amino acid oxidase-like deaminating enzyme